MVLVAGAATGVLGGILGSSGSTATGPTTAAAQPVADLGTAGLRADKVPTALIPLFEKAAAQSGCGLPAAVLAAQAQTESGYQPDAVSAAGAIGIMQFLPDTWAAYAVDGNGDGTASITDPADAIPAAAKLDCQLTQQIQQAGIAGDLTGLMLAAYNAGPGTVLGCRCIPDIPETRNYVASIEALAPTLTNTPPPAPVNTVPAAPLGGPGQFAYPLAVAATITQTYGNHSNGFHPGMDIAAPAGTPVLAATAGTVEWAGPNDGYGNYVCIQATPSLATCYAHLAVISVTVGQQVSRQQTVGAEGTTGNSTGPHLPFEVRIDGQTVDPAGYLPRA